jgi:hypothetical protein
VVEMLRERKTENGKLKAENGNGENLDVEGSGWCSGPAKRGPHPQIPGLPQLLCSSLRVRTRASTLG